MTCRDHSRNARQVGHHVEVRPVDAEHELGTRPHGLANLAGVERVDAYPHARVHQLADDVGESGKGAARGAADVERRRTFRHYL